MSVIKIQKYDYIDALRGIAILLVIIVHTSQKVVPFNDLLRRLMSNGDKGVQLFYIVSALTLCFSLESRKGKESKYILYFFIRRFFRIAPLFYLAILFYQFPFDFHGNYYAPNGIKGWYILSAATFTHGWHPETINSVVPGSWSIAVEYTFYLFLPFLFRLINNKEKAILFFIFTCIINCFISNWIYSYWANQYSKDLLYLAWGVSYYGFFNQLPVFAIGILLFQFFKDKTFNNSRMTSIVLIILSFFLMYAYTDYCSYYNYINQLVMYAIAFALLTYALANRSFTLFVNPIAKFTGKISYGMYFIHFAILDYFVGFNFWGLSRYGTYGTIIAILIVFLCTMFIATITYYLIEKNGVALGGHIISKLENNRILKRNQIKS